MDGHQHWPLRDRPLLHPPVAVGDPNKPETYDLGTGRLSRVDQRSVTDAGL
ncbi:MAG: hypothetical protein ACLQI7_30740 [Streptosporangiaceae bacterium]